jgi:hypothetical protein
VDTRAVDLAVDAGFEAVVPDNVPIDGSGIERPGEPFGRSIIPDGPQEGACNVCGVAGKNQVFLDEALSRSVDRHKTHLIPLALDPEMHYALAALDVAHAQPA